MTTFTQTPKRPNAQLNAINQSTYLTPQQHLSHAIITSEEALQDEIIQCLEDKQAYHVCSKGKNWGYGSRLGHENNTRLLDLSNMRQVEVHEKHGYVVMEAGASQQDVYDQLKASGSELMLPVTGSSADSSVIGNALGLGYANGRHTVRIEHILQLNGFTEKGEFIEGINDSSCKYQHKAPSQKLLGKEGTIITKAKMHLPAIPAQMLLISFGIEEEAKLTSLLEKLISYKKQGLIEGNWSVFSAHRLLAERDRKVHVTDDPDSFISYADAQKVLIERYGYQVWRGLYNGVFGCYLPSAAISAAVQAYIEEDLRPYVDTLEIMGVSKAEILAERDEAKGFAHLQTDNPILSRLKTFAGILQNGSIDIGYWKKEQLSEAKDMDKDNCGFIWLAISSPNDAQMLSLAQETINQTLGVYDLDPIFVIDGALAHESYLMCSLIFDKSDMNQCLQAGRAYKELSQKLAAQGLVNYRLPVPLATH